MTLISSIINDAFREGNIIPLGVAPNTNQAAEALRLYNALIGSIYGEDAGEPLQDWPLGNYGREHPNTCITERQLKHPIINRRLLALNEVALTVYLTPRAQDGSRYAIVDPFGRLAAFPVTLDANGRTIEGAATVLLNTNGLNREWFYRADLGGWVKLTALMATDENPFPAEFDNFFITLLAMRINPRYGRTMDAQSAEILKTDRKRFVARYLQSLPLEILDDISWPFMSTQGYDQQRAFGNSTYGFDRGNPWG